MNKYQKTPDEIIDLHGYTVAEAETALSEILKTGKCRHLRIITGKGTFREGGPVLREAVKAFMRKREIRVEQAKIQDGGEGALDVYFNF